MTRLLAVGAVAAAVFLPSASFGAATVSNLSGEITRVDGGIKVVIRNNGPDKTTWVWIKMPSSVQHTGASADGGGGCGPGGDANTVRCGFGLPTYFPAGETRTVTIMTRMLEHE